MLRLRSVEIDRLSVKNYRCNAGIYRLLCYAEGSIGLTFINMKAEWLRTLDGKTHLEDRWMEIDHLGPVSISKTSLSQSSGLGIA